VSAPWAVIAKRELIERIRTKWFVIGTLLGPIGMVALIVVPALLASATSKDVRVRIVDHTGKLAAPLVSDLGKLGWNVAEVAPDTPERALLDQIRDDAIDGFVTIPADGVEKGIVTYKGDNATNFEVVKRLDVVITNQIQRRRGVDAGLSQQQLDDVLAVVAVIPTHTTGETEGSSGAAAFAIGYIVMILLYIAIMLYAINVMRSVVQEKTSRVVELMVAAAKPTSLMVGKIIGVGAVGLIQLAVWLGMGALTLAYRDSLISALGGSSGGGFTIPPLSFVEVALILAYFILGYFFYASLYAAVGAMVSSEQEAQQAQTPVVMLLIIPMACTTLVSNDPRGSAAELMTQLPFSSPILMPMRYLLGGAGPAQVALSLAILALSTAAVALLAARIYRVGILMYGKRPTMRELARWLRY
jgi:ABC-2 type transport system permease protein